MLENYILETTNAPGTASTLNLGGAVAGRRSFASKFSTGAVVFYVLDDGTQAEWGYGTFTAGSPDTLSRDTVKGNTAGNTSRLNFAASGTRVYNTLLAEHTLYVNNGGTVIAYGGGALAISGLLSAGTVASSGAITADHGSITNTLTAGAIETPGAVSAGTLYTPGTVYTAAVAATGAINGAGGSITSTLTVGALSAGGLISGGGVSVTGTATAGALVATGTAGAVIAATGSIANTLTIGTVQATSLAAANASLTGTLAVTGAASAAAASSGSQLVRFDQFGVVNTLPRRDSLPGGRLRQSGTVTTSGGFANVVLGTPFSDTSYTVVLSPKYSGGGVPIVAWSVTNAGTFQVRGFADTSGTVMDGTIGWEAIGSPP